MYLCPATLGGSLESKNSMAMGNELIIVCTEKVAYWNASPIVWMTDWLAQWLNGWMDHRKTAWLKDGRSWLLLLWAISLSLQLHLLWENSSPSYSVLQWVQLFSDPTLIWAFWAPSLSQIFDNLSLRANKSTRPTSYWIATGNQWTSDACSLTCKAL